MIYILFERHKTWLISFYFYPISVKVFKTFGYDIQFSLNGPVLRWEYAGMASDWKFVFQFNLGRELDDNTYSEWNSTLIWDYSKHNVWIPFASSCLSWAANQEIPENHSASFVNSAKICKYILWRIIYLSGASLLLLHAFTALYNFVTIYLSLVLVVAAGLAEKTLVAFLFAEYSNMKHNPFE